MDLAVLLSTAKFYSQSGKVIQGNGIPPDFEVRDGLQSMQPDADAPEDDDSEEESPQKATPSEDLQLKKAIEILNTPFSERQKAA